MSAYSNETMLTIQEAVLLGHAMVQRLAVNAGIRAIFIKGPASVLQGLRESKTSWDVDVLVSPAQLELTLQALGDRGWRQRPVNPDSRTFPRHSVTVDHPEWPCCIDVHYRFPGMEYPAADCFEVMWSATNSCELAGIDLRVPSPPLGILILALHALRSPHLPELRQELELLSHLTATRSNAPLILKLASETGALAAARPFLEDMLQPCDALEWPEASREWRNRSIPNEPGVARLTVLLQAPWQDRFALLCGAVFPTREVFLSRDIYADMTLLGRAALHWSRWSRFLRALPRAARNIGKLRLAMETSSGARKSSGRLPLGPSSLLRFSYDYGESYHQSRHSCCRIGNTLPARHQGNAEGNVAGG